MVEDCSGEAGLNAKANDNRSTEDKRATLSAAATGIGRERGRVVVSWNADQAYQEIINIDDLVSWSVNSSTSHLLIILLP